MGKDSGIEWCSHTFNLWWGCTEVSPECDHCYARTWARRTGFQIWGKDAPRRTFSDKHHRQLFTWNKAAREAGRRDSVFWNSMSDICEDRRDLDEWRELAWLLASGTPNLDHLFLSKRPQNFARFFPLESRPQKHVWLGTTVGVRSSLWRADALRKTPAAVRFLSCEPLLEDLGALDLTGIHWVIVGGESGPGARPCNVDWIRSIVRQCRDAGTSAFVKQDSGKHPGKQGRIPDDLWVKEFPSAL